SSMSAAVGSRAVGTGDGIGAGDAGSRARLTGEPNGAANGEAMAAAGAGATIGATIGAPRPSHVAARSTTPRLSPGGAFAASARAYALASSPRGKCTR